MTDVVSPGHQMVSDDSAMAAPPDGFRAHKRHVSIARQVFDLAKGCLELTAKGVVCIIVKTMVKILTPLPYRMFEYLS